MKTIFITIFEGVEARSVLRTSIMETLLADPEVRIVFFTKSKERAKLYEREFSGERLFYEVVPPREPAGLDRLFSRLKFFLLKTPTTDLKRQLRFQEHGRTFQYLVGTLLNTVFARPSIRRIVRFLDAALINDRRYAAYFDRYSPNLVFVIHLFDNPEVHLVREARRRGVPSVCFISSWDKVTSRCILRLLPDKIIVFNELVKKEVMEHSEVKNEDIVVCGLPHYDHYFRGSCADKKVFFEQIGIKTNNKLIVYAPVGRAFSNSDWNFIDLLHRLRDEGKFGNHVEILVRFQPNDFVDASEIKKRPGLRFDYPGTRFSSERGVDWDMSFKDLEHLKNTLCHLSLLICYASSLSIDAAVFNKPVINIDFELRGQEDPLKSPIQYFKTDHYAKALRTGGIRLVRNEIELIEWVNRYLQNPGVDHEGRARLVKEQVGFPDGNSGKRIGEFLLGMMKRA